MFKPIAKLLGALTAIVLLSGLAGCNKQTAPSSPPSASPVARSLGPLAFVSTRDGAPYIYVANSDGSNVTRLVPGEQPAWSADGTRIAFQRGPSSAPGVYVMNADGSSVRSVGYGAAPAWSPDGRLAVQDSCCGGGISVMNADGSGRTRIASPGFRSLDDGLLTPCWSPDGQRIGFVAANFDEPRQIYIVTTAGGAPHVLIGGSDVSTQSDPSWSPDGSRVAFIGIFTLQTVRIDGTGLQSAVSGDAFEPDWGPDGQFVFGRFVGGSGEGAPMRIFIGNGASARQLVPDAPGGNYRDYQPAWSRR